MQPNVSLGSEEEKKTQKVQKEIIKLDLDKQAINDGRLRRIVILTS